MSSARADKPTVLSRASSWLGLDPDHEWERLGETEPYWGVSTFDRFRAASLKPESLAEFFASGEDHVTWLLDFVRKHHGDWARERALDLGCGVGRVLIPLSSRFDEVVGVDVSSGMLARARAESEARNLTNIDLVRGDDELSRVKGTFDFVHSFIVLQHVPVDRGMKLLNAMLSLLRTDGVGAIHITYARRRALPSEIAQYIQNRVPLAKFVTNVLRRQPWNQPAVQLNTYDLNDVFRVLQTRGCTNASASFTEHGNHFGMLITFRRSN